MKMKIIMAILASIATTMTTTNPSLAGSKNAQATKYSTQQIVNKLKRKGTLKASTPAGIVCCTTWDSSKGTTGCASFDADSCPAGMFVGY